MASSSSFHQWLQRQHGIGALLLPLAALVVLVIALWLNQSPGPIEEPTPFQDYPLDAGTPRIDSSAEPDPVAPMPEEQPVRSRAAEDRPPSTPPAPPAEQAPGNPVRDLGSPARSDEVPAPPGAE
ncbi:MAG TPA: hypothetical protein PLL78_06080 [Fimbriimonadaceae bacterium]|nr:hypothetical protein [Fimbriimonadaceae bacterium]HRJ96235.1 hypothetical protein [Fimbriimonadaceae bacterium]